MLRNGSGGAWRAGEAIAVGAERGAAEEASAELFTTDPAPDGRAAPAGGSVGPDHSPAVHAGTVIADVALNNAESIGLANAIHSSTDSISPAAPKAAVARAVPDSPELLPLPHHLHSAHDPVSPDQPSQSAWPDSPEVLSLCRFGSPWVLRRLQGLERAWNLWMQE